MKKFLHRFNKKFGRRELTLVIIIGGFLIIGVAEDTIRDFKQRVTAEPPKSLSQDIEFFHTGKVSAVQSFAGDADTILLGGGTQTDFTRSPKLASYKGGLLANLSNGLKNFSGATIEAIGFDGSSWLVGGGNPSSPYMTPRLNEYNSETFTDKSELLKAYKGYVSTVSWNGSYWLLGINIPGFPPNEQNVLVRLDGETVTEVVSSGIRPPLQGTSITNIEWNGNYWLIAYENGLETDAPGMHELPKTRLLRYDGSSVTELHPTSFVKYSVLDAAWNGTEWLIATYIVNVGTNLQIYNGDAFRPIPASLPEKLLAVSIEWAGDYWIIGTVKEEASWNAGILVNPASNKNIDAVQFWKFDGTDLFLLGGFPKGVLLNTLFFEKNKKELFIGGIGQTYSQLFAVQTPERLPVFPAGTLLRATDKPEIFTIIDNKKRHIPNFAVFTSYGYRLENVQTVPRETLVRIPDVKLIKTAGDAKIWHLDRGQKRWLKDLGAFNAYGFNWNDVVTVNALDLAAYRTARLVRVQNEEEIYYVTQNGMRRHIPNPQTFTSYGNKWEDVVEIKASELYAYPQNELIRLEGDPRVWRIEKDKKSWIKTLGAFYREGYGFNNVAPVNMTEFNSYQEGESID